MTWEYSTVRLHLGNVFREGKIGAELWKMDEDVSWLKQRYTDIHRYEGIWGI